MSPMRPPSADNSSDHAAAVIGPSAGRPAGLLGRDLELAQLAAMVDRARAGSPGSVVIEGAPGVGKTALLDAAVGGAEGCTVLRFGGVESESALGFGALFGLLAPLTVELEAVPGPSGAALRSALGIGEGQPVDRLSAGAGLLLLLAAVAATTPLLIIGDDVQWFDPESLDLLAFAVRRLRADAVVCWLAAREREIPSQLEGFERLALDGLDRASSRALLERDGRRLSETVVERLWFETAGNPLALTELSARRGQGELDETGPTASLPPLGDRLRDAFSAQVTTLDEGSQRALVVAAASFTSSLDLVVDALRRLGLDADALHPAEQQALITIGGGTLSWRHPLLRAAVHDRAAAAERRAAHAALADAAGSRGLDGQRAWHRAAAALGPDEEVAAELEKVGAEAVRRGAWPTAARAYTQAAQLSPDGDERVRRQLLAAEFAAAVGDFDQALALADRAQRNSADARLRAQAWLIRGRVAILSGQLAVWPARLVEAAEAVAEVDPAMAAIMMIEAVVSHLGSGDREQFIRTARRAWEIGRPLGGMIEAAAATARAASMVIYETPRDALPLLARAAPAMQDPSLWQIAPELAGLYGRVIFGTGDFAGGERLLAAIIDHSRQTGAVRGRYYPLVNRAIALFELGRWPAALADAEEAIELCSPQPDSQVLALAQSAAALIEAGRGHGERARELAELSIATCARAGSPMLPRAPAALALLALGAELPEAAVAALERIDPRFSDMSEPSWYWLEPLRVEAYGRAGQRAAAQQILARLQFQASRSSGPWAAAVTARCEGLLANDDAFAAHFDDALAKFRPLPLPFDRAWTQLCYGERLRRARRRRDARTQLSRAADTFRALGAEAWLRRAERELAAAGQRASAPRPPTPWSQLTAAETRVTRQIIDGATYEEAATALFLSPRTIETHLRQIYRKLGVRSRTELTRVLSSQVRSLP